MTAVKPGRDQKKRVKFVRDLVGMETKMRPMQCLSVTVRFPHYLVSDGQCNGQQKGHQNYHINL